MSTDLMTANYPIPGDSLDAYMQQINRIPVLSQEEEEQLARRLRDHNDLDAARALVVSHLRFVAHIARSYKGYGLPQQDLIQEGTIGLMKAVKRFDPDQGVRLVSFAVHWIRAEIHEYILRNWRIVKVATTKAQRRLFFKLRSMKRHLGWLSGEEADAVAKDLGVSTDTVYEMESRLSGKDVTFDLSDSDDDAAAPAPAAYLQSPQLDPALQLEHQDQQQRDSKALQEALQKLDPRSLDIIRRRWMNEEEKATLHDLAAEYGVSAERIRQIEKAAMKKVRSALQA